MGIFSITRREVVRQARRRTVRALRKSGRHHKRSGNGRRRTVAGGAVLIVLAASLVTFTRADFYPSMRTFGVDAGTASHYCSLDMVRWHFEESCESAQ